MLQLLPELLQCLIPVCNRDTSSRVQHMQPSTALLCINILGWHARQHDGVCSSMMVHSKASTSVTGRIVSMVSVTSAAWSKDMSNAAGGLLQVSKCAVCSVCSYTWLADCSWGRSGLQSFHRWQDMDKRWCRLSNGPFSRPQHAFAVIVAELPQRTWQFGRCVSAWWNLPANDVNRDAAVACGGPLSYGLAITHRLPFTSQI